MKWLREIAIIVLLFLLGFLLYDYINEQHKIADVSQELKKWQDAYAELADTHDALGSAYAILLTEFQQKDSLYNRQLQINKAQYEKNMAAFDTLTVDEHIQLLSDYLSQKDSLSW